jgi:hypothetical protein
MDPLVDAVLCALMMWTFRDHLSISTLVPSKGYSFDGGYCFWCSAQSPQAGIAVQLITPLTRLNAVCPMAKSLDPF